MNEEQMVCPEYGEVALELAPTALSPEFQARPSWSHVDGEPLCPVMSAGGYVPAEPVPAAESEFDEAGCDTYLAEVAGLDVELPVDLVDDEADTARDLLARINAAGVHDVGAGGHDLRPAFR